MFGWLTGIGHALQGGLCWVLTTVGTVPADALKQGLNVVRAFVCNEPPSQ